MRSYGRNYAGNCSARNAVHGLWPDLGISGNYRKKFDFEDIGLEHFAKTVPVEFFLGTGGIVVPLVDSVN